MRTRDHYDWQLTCPACGAAGTARVSEEAFPENGNITFAVDEVSEGFRVSRLGKSAVDTVIVCVKCDAEV